MPDRSRDAALAGFLLVVTAVLIGGIGLGIGLAVGAPALLGILGLFIGFGVGFTVVYTRFKDTEMPVGLRVLKNLDIVFLVCALPIFIGAAAAARLGRRHGGLPEPAVDRRAAEAQRHQGRRHGRLPGRDGRGA